MRLLRHRYQPRSKARSETGNEAIEVPVLASFPGPIRDWERGYGGRYVLKSTMQFHATQCTDGLEASQASVCVREGRLIKLPM